LTLGPSTERTTPPSCTRSLRTMKSTHHPEVRMKTQLQTSYVKLTALLVVTAPLALALGGARYGG